MTALLKEKQTKNTALTFEELQQVRSCFPKGFNVLSKINFEGRDIILVKECKGE